MPPERIRSYDGCAALWQMTFDNEQDRQGRERISDFMHADTDADKKQLTEEELRALQTAATRLEEMLAAAEESERQALRDAATRLDRLLLDIDAGKDVIPAMNRRSET